MASIIFKLGMLPSMIARLMGNDSIITVFLLSLLDVTLIFITFFIAKKGGIIAVLSKYKKQPPTPSEIFEKNNENKAVPYKEPPTNASGSINSAPKENAANDNANSEAENAPYSNINAAPDCSVSDSDINSASHTAIPEATAVPTFSINQTPGNTPPENSSAGEKERAHYYPENAANKAAAIPLWAKIFILIPLCLFFMVKTVIYSSELISYTAERLFDGIKWIIVVIAIIPTMFMIGKKKLYVLGRLAQICLWVIAVAVIFNLIFNTFNLNFQNILPLGTKGAAKIFSSPFQFLWYAGDCLPLLFASITPCENDSKRTKSYLRIFLIPIITTLYFGLCIITYGNALPEVSDVFSRLALFNSVSDDLGAFDLPLVASWLSMAMLALSMYCYGIRHCAECVTGGKIAYPIIALVLGVILSLYVRNYAIIERIFVISPFAIFGIFSFILVMVIFLLAVRNECKKDRWKNE